MNHQMAGALLDCLVLGYLSHDAQRLQGVDSQERTFSKCHLQCSQIPWVIQSKFFPL